ncbi:MAG: pyridine nucleotide-disulfide oxidoreductase, partial [Kiritimatiellae bacterium]|nr:pyridine nucleotide-disulfide oxidoreductase [Kiritimatiellia bacterium]
MKNLLLASALILGSSLGFAGRVDIHPQAFDPGGWKVDVQFMDVMGSAYLLAHGNGIRCLDAKAVANIP